jgi:hypothetical protein
MKTTFAICFLCILSLPLISQNSSIVVITPNGGENWLIGCQQTIQWTTTTPGMVKIELFRNGSFYMTLANQIPVTQTAFSWIPPYSILPGNTFKVKISSLTSSSGFDFSDAYFSINKGTISLISPNGGEAWLYGTTHLIQWNDNICENVRIELWKGGSYFALLTASTPSNGSFPWAITSAIPAGSDYKVKVMSTALVSATSNLAFDFSDNNFTVGTANPCFMTVTCPNGGEIWAKGTTQMITWQDNVTYPVRIELWKNGLYKSLIAASVPSTGNYLWVIPASLPSGSDYKVKIIAVTSTASFTCYDLSDNNFSLIGSATGGFKSVEKDFHAYPNPCNNFMNVIIPGNTGAKTSIKIMDITGKMVFDQSIQENQQSEELKINTSEIADGFYILLIRQNQEIVYKKTIMINH